MDSRKAKLNQSIFTELFQLIFDNAGDLELSSQITNMLAFGFEAKSFAKQNTCNDKLTLSTACWQNCKNITTCEMQFQCSDLLWFQSFPFSESEIYRISNVDNVWSTLLA